MMLRRPDTLPFLRGCGYARLACSSSFTTSEWPCHAAEYRGVLPYCVKSVGTVVYISMYVAFSYLHVYSL